jgi:hypothetical protein
MSELLTQDTVETFGDWQLDDSGLYHHGQDYMIEANRLGEQRMGAAKGVSDWALHILEKNWVDPEQFIPALKRAIERHPPKTAIDWPATVKAIRKQAYLDVCWQEAERRLGNPKQIINVMTITDDVIDKLANHLAAVGWRPRPSAVREFARRGSQ